MNIAKALAFFIVAVLGFVAAVVYSNWSLSRVFIYLLIALAFFVVAYILYKNMFTDDE